MVMGSNTDGNVIIRQIRERIECIFSWLPCEHVTFFQCIIGPLDRGAVLLEVTVMHRSHAQLFCGESGEQKQTLAFDVYPRRELSQKRNGALVVSLVTSSQIKCPNFALHYA